MKGGWDLSLICDTLFPMKGLLYVIQRFLLKRPFMVAKENRFNCRFQFKSPDCVGRTIYRKGDYEPDLTKYILENLHFEEGDIFFDIGANIGWYAILLAKQFGKALQVYAFEPDDLNFSLLSGNLKRNAVENITPIKFAAAEEAATKTLYRYKEGNLGRHSLLPTEGLETQNVNTITLDRFVEERHITPEKVKLIKMDIEGYEYFALRGAEKLLRHMPLILTEYSPEMMKERAIDPSEFLSFMERFHFQPHQLTEGKLMPVSFQELANQKEPVSDIFWVKSPECGLSGHMIQ